MADYVFNPMVVQTPYGDVAINDPLAEANLRAKIQADLAAKRQADADAIIQRQADIAAAQNQANIEASNNALLVAQQRYDQLMAQKAQALQTQQGQVAGTTAPLVDANTDPSTAWEHYKNAGNYNNLPVDQKAQYIEQTADAMQKTYGWSTNTRDSVADAMIKKETEAGTLGPNTFAAKVVESVTKGAFVPKVAAALASVVPNIKGVVDAVGASEWELENQARILRDTETSPYYQQDLTAIKAAIRPEMQSSAAKELQATGAMQAAIDAKRKEFTTAEQLVADTSRAHRGQRGFTAAAEQVIAHPIASAEDTIAYMAPLMALTAATGGGNLIGAPLLAAGGFTDSQQAQFDAGYKAAKSSGASDEEALKAGLQQSQTTSSQMSKLAGAAAAALDALGPIGGKTAGIIGAAGKRLLTREATDLATGATKSSIVKGAADIIKGAASESSQEGIQSAQEKYNQNLAEVQAGTRDPSALWDGVWQQAKVGMGAASVLGGAFGGLEAFGNNTAPVNIPSMKKETGSTEANAPTSMASQLDGETTLTPTSAATSASTESTAIAVPYREKDYASATKGMQFAPERTADETFASYYDKVVAERDASLTIADSTEQMQGVDKAVAKIKADENEKLRVKLYTAAQTAATKAIGSDPIKAAAGYVAGVLQDNGKPDMATTVVATAIGSLPIAPTIDAARIAINNGKIFPTKTIVESFGAALQTVVDKLPPNISQAYSDALNAEQLAPQPEATIAHEDVVSVADKIYNNAPLTANEQRIASTYKEVTSLVNRYQRGYEVTPTQYAAYKETGVVPPALQDVRNRPGAEVMGSAQVKEILSKMKSAEEFATEAMKQDSGTLAQAQAERYNQSEAVYDKTYSAVDTEEDYPTTFVGAFDAVAAQMAMDIDVTDDFAAMRYRADAIVRAASNKEELKKLVGGWYRRRKSTTATVSELIDHIIDSLPAELQIEYSSRTAPKDVEGMYTEGTNLITIVPSQAAPEKVFMHEATHMVTADAMERARTSGGTSRASYDAIMRILADSKVRAVMDKAVSINFEKDPVTYGKEALTVLTDSKYGYVRTALSKIKVAVTPLQRTSALQAIWHNVLKLIGWDGTAGQTDALSALYAHTFNIVKAPKIKKGGQTLYSQRFNPGGTDLIKFKKAESTAQHDGLAWYDNVSDEWVAEWVNDNGVDVERRFDSMEEATVALADAGLHPMARGRNTRLANEAVVPTTAMRLSLMGNAAFKFKRLTETLKGNGFSSDATLALATEAGMQWSYLIGTKRIDDLKLMDAMDRSGALRAEIKQIRRETAADLEHEGFGRLSVYAAVNKFKERLHAANLTAEEIGTFAYAMAVPGYLKAVAANNGTDPYVLSLTQFRGSGFSFVDKKGVKHKAVLSIGMSMEQKIEAEQSIVDAYLAQFTKSELDTLAAVMEPLWKGNQIVLELMHSVGGVTDIQYEAYKNNPYYAPLKDHEAHSLVKVEAAIGRYTEADNPAIMLAAQIQAMRLRVSRLAELQTIGEFLSKNPSPHFEMATDNFNVSGGEIKWDSPYMGEGGVVRIPYANGTILYVKPRSGAAKSFFKKAPEATWGKFLRAAATYNRFKALTLTSGSYAFQPVQIMWDAANTIANPQGAMGKDANGNWRLAIKDTPLFLGRLATMGASYLPQLASAAVKGTTISPLVRMYHADGASMNPGVSADFGSMRRDITAKTLLNASQAKSAIEKNKVAGTIAVANAVVGAGRSGLGKVVDTLHVTSEFFRFGMYAATLEHLSGMDLSKATKAQLDELTAKYPEARKIAAQAANDVTTDFSLKGADPTLRSLIIFFQAAMNSTFRMIPQILTSPWGLTVVTAFVLMSAAARMMQCDSEGLDADGVPRCLRQKKQDALLSIGGEWGAPVGPEFRPAKSIGDNMADMLAGRISVIDAFLGSEACPHCGILSSVAGAITPFRYTSSELSAAGIAYSVAPTMLGSIVQQITEKDAFGKPIMAGTVYDAQGKKKVNPMDWERGRSSDSQFSKDLTRNVAMFTEGKIDLAPFTFDMVARELTGAYFTLAKNIYDGKDAASTALPGFKGGYDTYAAKNQAEDTQRGLANKISLLEAARDAGEPYNVLELQQLTHSQKKILQAKQRDRSKTTNGMTAAELYRALDAAKQRGDSDKIAYYNELIDSLNSASSVQRNNLLEQLWKK